MTPDNTTPTTPSEPMAAIDAGGGYPDYPKPLGWLRDGNLNGGLTFQREMSDLDLLVHSTSPVYSPAQMRVFADATAALRAGQVAAQPNDAEIAEIIEAWDASNGSYESVRAVLARFATYSPVAPVQAAQADVWHEAVLHACIVVDCYVKDDPKASVNNLIDWYVKVERDAALSAPPIESKVPAEYEAWSRDRDAVPASPLPRFHIDHATIHDRVTGKHVTTDQIADGFSGGIEHCCTLLNELAVLVAAVAPIESKTFQQRIHPHAIAAYGAAHMADVPTVVGHFFEEATETAQAAGMSEEEAIRRVRYTYARPVGELPKEIGSVMSTLAALATAVGVDMHAMAEADLVHISWLEVSIGLAARHARKAEKFAAMASIESKGVRKVDDKDFVTSLVHILETQQGDPEDDRYDDGRAEALRIWKQIQAVMPTLAMPITAVPAGEQQAGIPGNFITHRAAWRKAIENLAAQDDSGYWQHELAAFDRSFDRLWIYMNANPAAGVPGVVQPPADAETIAKAKRYDWLTECPHVPWGRFLPDCQNTGIDAAIDAAMPLPQPASDAKGGA